MTDDLRTTLRHLADTAEPLPLADDLWRRGRTTRHRDRALVVAAVLAIIVSVAWSAVLLRDGGRETRTASSTADVGLGAIPSRIEDIPEDLDVTTDLKVGRGSAAFISPTQQAPVVVTATDGVAHRLELPGWTRDAQALTLSPDGLRLAWQQTGTSGATVSVLELLSGRTWSHQVHPDGDLALRELAWSPDSVWLAWLGDADGGAHVGRLRPVYAPMPLRWFVDGNIPDIAVSSDARTVMSRARGGLLWLGEEPQPITRATDVGAGSFSPDGRFLALRSAPSGASATLRWSDREVLTHPFPDGTFDAAAVHPLGWLDERHQLLQVRSDEDEDAELVVTTPRVGPTSTWRRSVGSVNAAIAGRVSVAVDLMPGLDGTSSQQLTHDFGDSTAGPPTPLGMELSLFIGLGVAAAIAALLALRWLWRRLLT